MKTGPWIDREYAFANPVAKERLPAYLFHGLWFNNRLLDSIEKMGLCPKEITAEIGWFVSYPHGVYVDVNPVVAYEWGGGDPVVLVIKSKDLPTKCEIYYDWHLPIARTKRDLRDSGQAYIITACGCLSPVYALVNKRIRGKFQIVILPLAQARRGNGFGIVDKYQLRRFVSTILT